MNKPIPDKWVRKAVHDAIDGLVVDGEVITCHDTHLTYDAQTGEPDHYVLMTTQTAEVDKNNKCEWFYESTLLLDIITTYSGAGNPGTRVLADNIQDACRAALNGLVLGGGLEVVKQNFSFPADITTNTNAEVIFRKFIRLELMIK